MLIEGNFSLALHMLK